MAASMTKPPSFHLFNCDNTYNLDGVEELINSVTRQKAVVEKIYFPLPQMAELCMKIEEMELEYAVFVVHAHESRLSINEERAGIGYAKVYRTLLRATNDRVLVVIAGDDSYKSRDEADMNVLSHWARRKIISQFNEEYLDGSKSFIFSWDEKHSPIHEDALRFYLTPTKTGPFVPKPRPKPIPPQPTPLKEELKIVTMEQPPEKTYTRPLPIGPGPVPGERTMARQGDASDRQLGLSHTGQQVARVTTRVEPSNTAGIGRKLPGGTTDLKENQRSERKIALQVFAHTESRESIEIVYQFLSAIYTKLSIQGPPEAMDVDHDQLVSHIIHSKLEYLVIATDSSVLTNLDRETEQFFVTIFQCINRHVEKKVIIMVCYDGTSSRNTEVSPFVQGVVSRITTGILDPNKLMVMSWEEQPSQIHKEAMLNLFKGNQRSINSATLKEEARNDQLGVGRGSLGVGNERWEQGGHAGGQYLGTKQPTYSSPSSSTKIHNQGTQEYGQTAGPSRQSQDQGGASHQHHQQGVPTLCYQAWLRYGHPEQPVLLKEPWISDYEIGYFLRNYESEEKTYLEVWRDPDGKLSPCVPIFNKHKGRLRYQAVMQNGHITQVTHRDPPNWQPPEYILNDMKERHRLEPKVELEVWQDQTGALCPTVKTDTGFSIIPKFIKNAFR